MEVVCNKNNKHLAVPFEGYVHNSGTKRQEKRHSPNSSSPLHQCYLALHMFGGLQSSLAPRAIPATAFGEAETRAGVPVTSGPDPWGPTEHPRVGASHGHPFPTATA